MNFGRVSGDAVQEGTALEMGYFSNGSEGDDYERRYCNRCVHEDDKDGCPVMLAHLLHNYDECNNEDSILHLLIPRMANGFNDQCKLFIEHSTPATSREEVSTMEPAVTTSASAAQQENSEVAIICQQLVDLTPEGK